MTDRDGGARDAKLAADGPPDAPRTTVLHVQIEGQGRVTVQNVGMCDAVGADKGDCLFDVLVDEPVTVTAVEYPDWMFDKWTTLPCITASTICTFTPTTMTDIIAKFRKEG